MLTSLTGYRLTKAAAGRPGGGRDRFPADFDEDHRAIIGAVRPYTMTGNAKLHALITATRYIHEIGRAHV